MEFLRQFCNYFRYTFGIKCTSETAVGRQKRTGRWNLAGGWAGGTGCWRHGPVGSRSSGRQQPAIARRVAAPLIANAPGPADALSALLNGRQLLGPQRLGR